jgi:hypothetical protein
LHVHLRQVLLSRFQGRIDCESRDRYVLV